MTYDLLCNPTALYSRFLQMQKDQGCMSNSHFHLSVSLEGTSGKHQAVMCIGVCTCMQRSEVRLRCHPLVVVVGECVFYLAGWLAGSPRGLAGLPFDVDAGVKLKSLCLPC